ncbi:MAG: S-layer homology domain-containing protein, partial [Peptococcaceae bacterium]|nr:S-layer homology domain-containing protein [Peptococcaceae bacterium]
FAAEPSRLDNAVNSTAAYVYGIVKNPEVGSVGGEWAVIGLARSGYEVPAAYYAAYYKTVEQYVKERQGVLHEKKYTEYSRLILGLTAAGYDPRNVAGYDLTLALGDFERTIWQGINGPVWALIALDSLNYSIPANPAAKTQATRDLYIKEILHRQLADGGWNLTAGANGTIDAQERADADLTGMALQALAKYQEQPEVKAATDKALACLSQLQNPSGGYAYGSATASESTVQVLVALCELGITVDDPRFVKNGQTLVDNILSFRNADGSFNHSGSGGNNQMSTEQALYGLAAAKRAAENKNSLYRLSDAVKRGDFPSAAVGLPAKHADVQAVPVLSLGKTFDDVKNHPNQTAIEALAARGIITGVSETRFAPDAVMTRAEFAVLLTRGLGLSEKPAYTFADVPSAAWYAGYLGAASFYGITDSDVVAFNPNGAITRQEAAVMTARAAQLCGMETALDPVTIRDTLAQFGDYRTVAYRAQGPLAFCYRKGILDDAAFDIKPAAAGKRGEIAEMLYRLLAKAALL